MRHHSDLTGILVLDKELGMSSMRAVEIARRRAGRAKAGHAGTLDPLATGVLVVAFGRATKAIDLLMATEKRYETDVDLSAFTTTDDREGERREIAVATPPTREAVEQALAGFVGTISQRPPAFSAVHVGGKRAYALARADAPPELPPRSVVVHEARLLDYAWPVARVALRTGKGFYVRSLARDLGVALGTGGHCATLRRTAVGPFAVEHARTLSALPEQIDESCLIPLESALALVGALGPR
ncbi:MAG: tRNA pseudouridine(55) synthase TruB [Planctomycetota bacterium]